MTRRMHRLLYVAYSALFTWLAVCAVQAAIHHVPWACAVFVLGSALAVVAFMRESALDDALRRTPIRAEREARPPAATDASDDVVAVALAAACCEQWWASAGTDHDPTCPNHQHRSNA
ncbi:hypothetical protein [Streptomyces sediminimaris]|uniref:hypothetical protein n=1 Tax=Streptomyces sediminimaris TaxID=3383721 RepID=UPI003999FBBB